MLYPLKQHCARLVGFLRVRGAMLLAAGVLTAAVLAQAQVLAATTSFAIPAQPLGSAIDAFCAAAGTEVYYDGAAARDLKSSAVMGTFEEDDALRKLLAGTDLVALRAHGNGYLLMHPGDETGRAMAAALIARDLQYQRYFAVVQADIADLLCRNEAIRPNVSRLVLRLWIGPGGVVQRADIDGPSGDQERGRLFAAALRAIRLTEPAPPQMPQPITMVVLPGAMSAHANCATANKAGGR